jgi:hypothetical protein
MFVIVIFGHFWVVLRPSKLGLYKMADTKSKKVIKARDIAPEAYKPAVAEKEDDLQYDLGLLSAFDTHPVDVVKFRADPEGFLLESARDNVQLLINRIFALPTEKSEVGPVVCAVI